MSERVSDERLKELASIQSRAAAMYALEFDEDVLSVIEELIERRAADRHDYESELRRLSEFVQSRHPSGAVKHIGLMEAVPSAMELISEASEWIGRQLKDDDNEPITAEWASELDPCIDEVEGTAFLLVGDALDSYWYIAVREDSSVAMWTQSCGNDLPHIRTRGDLRRLWLSLTGKELGS